MNLFNKYKKPALFIIKGHSLFSFQLVMEINDRTDFQVIDFNNAEEAMSELSVRHPEVVIIDEGKDKGMTTQQAVIAIKSILPDTYVIILSSGGNAERAMDLMKTGADSFVNNSENALSRVLNEISSLTTFSTSKG